ncbi:hypothetical protein BC941DRAFT_439610 [Chlamydoabsidia padenii]|nr:hypothetical protein BC941DRAFT_439610 [Chlamydoabsidia padenii]
MSNKTFTQQRAILRPNKNAAFFADDDDDEDDDDDLYSLTDDGSSSVVSISNNADTLVLAQFLASTGPEEFLKPSKKQQQNPQFRRASRLFNRLRKKGAQQGINTTTLLSSVAPISIVAKGNSNSLRSAHGQTKATHMPLPVYQPTSSMPSAISNADPISNAAVHATSPSSQNSNKNMAFLSHQPKPRQRHNHHQEQTITPTKSTSTSSVSSHNAPHPSASRSTSSNTSRRQLSLRDSGVYSDFSEKEDMIPPVPAPSLPVKSQFRSSQHHTQPKRPAPLPASVASAAIASATAATKDILPPPIPPFNQRRALSSTSASSSSDRRSVIRHSGAVPAAALKRRSVRIRHIQVQTDRSTSKAEEEGEHVCSHCHRPLIKENSEYDGRRRTSCPSVLPNGQLIPKQPLPTNGESKQLLEMIEQLKAQLAQEQQSRLQLEQAMSRQQETAKKIDLVQREKDRWKGDCLWLNDRIALLPE